MKSGFSSTLSTFVKDLEVCFDSVDYGTLDDRSWFNSWERLLRGWNICIRVACSHLHTE